MSIFSSIIAEANEKAADQALKEIKKEVKGVKGEEDMIEGARMMYEKLDEAGVFEE